MTGPEHYREAEKLIEACHKRMAGDDRTFVQTPIRRAELLTEAQVHATLALAAATALGLDDMPEPDYYGWYNAASMGKPIPGRVS